VCHGPDTKKALKAGKHVVVEKPMAVGLAEADSMIRAAKAARRKLFVHQNYRFMRAFTFLEDVISSGKLGKIFYIRNGSNGFSRRNDWQTLSKNAGGVLNNTCPHNIDQILQLVGSPIVKVLGDLQQIASAGDVEDHVKAFMKAKNGCTVDLEVTSSINNAVAPPRWVIAGQYGTLTIPADGKQAVLRYFDPKKAGKLTVNDGPAADRKYGNDDKLPWVEETLPVEGRDVGNFYDNVYAVLRDRKPMRVTPESVREVIRVIAEIRKGTNFPGRPVKKAAKRAKK
jgi:predicted dehydrogenase